MIVLKVNCALSTNEALTDEHTQLTATHNKVGDLPSEFVQVTLALSEAAGTFDVFAGCETDVVIKL